MQEKSRDARPSVEYSGKTVADALRRAAETLGVASDALEYEIIRDSSHSILGLVRTGEVVIHAWPRAGGDQPSTSARAEEPPVSAPVDQGETLKVPEEESAEGVLPVDEYEEEVAEAEEEEPGAFVGEYEEETAEALAHSETKVSPAEVERVASEVVSTLLDKMGLIAAVEVTERGGDVDPVTNEPAPLVFNIVGDDLGMLIGRRGETLRDLQFITRMIVSRRLGTWPNIVLDVEGYKAKRVSALRSLAARMADQVRRTKRPVILEPMPAHERRIIHLTLRNDPDVYTESTGEDEGRKVQILPK